MGFPGKKRIWSTISNRRPPERRAILTTDQKPERRRILYGRRRGRQLRAGQRVLVENLLPDLEMDVAPGFDPVSPRDLFGAEIGEVWLEIGFGGGEHLAWQAKNNPDKGLIGCEPFINGVVKLLGSIRDNDLGNIRLFRDDARLLVERLPVASIGRAFILFPDPWPKLRHHKRRIVSGSVIDLLASALADGAELRIATDDPNYLEWILWHMQRNPAFIWQVKSPRDWRERPDDWPATRYEQKAAAAGRKSAFLSYIRRDRSAIATL